MQWQAIEFYIHSTLWFYDPLIYRLSPWSTVPAIYLVHRDPAYDIFQRAQGFFNTLLILQNRIGWKRRTDLRSPSKFGVKVEIEYVSPQIQDQHYNHYITLPLHNHLVTLWQSHTFAKLQKTEREKKTVLAETIDNMSSLRSFNKLSEAKMEFEPGSLKHSVPLHHVELACCAAPNGLPTPRNKISMDFHHSKGNRV